MKPKVKLFIALGITIVSLILVLEFQPKVGWVLARLGCLIYAALFAWFTYSGANFASGVNEAKGQFKDVTTNYKDFDSVDSTLARVPFLAWLAIWVVFTQIMVSFYIAEM